MAQSLATRVVALEDTVARLLDNLCNEGILTNDMVMDIGMFHGLAAQPTPKTRARPSREVLEPASLRRVRQRQGSEPLLGERRGSRQAAAADLKPLTERSPPSCHYGNNPNMEGCTKVAEYQVHRNASSAKPKNPWVCFTCKEWMEDEGCIDQALTQLLDDE